VNGSIKLLSWALVLVLFWIIGCTKKSQVGVAFVSEWGSKGSAPGEFNQPIGVALDDEGNVYVSDAGNNRIQKFTADGAFIVEWGTAGNGQG